MITTIRGWWASKAICSDHQNAAMDHLWRNPFFSTKPQPFQNLGYPYNQYSSIINLIFFFHCFHHVFIMFHLFLYEKLRKKTLGLHHWATAGTRRLGAGGHGHWIAWQVPQDLAGGSGWFITSISRMFSMVWLAKLVAIVFFRFYIGLVVYQYIGLVRVAIAT